MNDVLFVVGTDLSANNSASLCHTAYINGMIDAGYNVSVISVKPTAAEVDYKTANIKYYEIKDDNFLVRYARNKRKSISAGVCCESDNAGKQGIKQKIKNIINNQIGAMATWQRRASRFKSESKYDLVISLSCPPISHIVAHNLIRKKYITTKHWCEIWEDPWSTDLYGGKIDKKVFAAEKTILAFAQKVLYVSPITLKRQQELFPEFADKMNWLPLPAYYQVDGNDKLKEKSGNKVRFGYFGQYYPHVRNLEPFYKAAVAENILCTICGDPSSLFRETKNIIITPRIPLKELKQIENDTDVLVFVANLGGGQIPGKIYQYSATTKKILFILDGSEEEMNILRDYFGKFNRYIFCQNKIPSIRSALKIIISNNNDKLTSEPIKDFEPCVIAQKIVSYCLI